MQNLSLFTKLILKFNPHYLYQGKWLQNVADLPVSLLHQISPLEREWKFMDYLTMKKASVISYLGTVKSLKLKGELPPKNLVFEVVSADSERTLNPGDVIMLERKNLFSFSDAPKS